MVVKNIKKIPDIASKVASQTISIVKSAVNTTKNVSGFTNKFIIFICVVLFMWSLILLLNYL